MTSPTASKTYLCDRSLVCCCANSQFASHRTHELTPQLDHLPIPRRDHPRRVWLRQDASNVESLAAVLARERSGRVERLVLHVGPLTSNHDQACETFYQLYGGRVDYGEQHSLQTGHERYGATHNNALHSSWNAANPVHLVGHSFGATTALELYQLLCADFFRVGSDYRWVRSIVSIAGPLTGSTVAHLVGVTDGKMTRGSPIYVLYVAFVLWFKLYQAFPVLKPACDVHWDQWSNLSLMEMLAVNGPVNGSKDLGVHDAVSSRCIERNARLEHLDKLHLLTILSSPKMAAPPLRDGVALALVLLLLSRHGAFRAWRALFRRFRLLRVLFALYLLRKVRGMNLVALPTWTPSMGYAPSCQSAASGRSWL
ncbi:hypothetical protein PHYPSEUDO_010606 [Phytophthora pseudosyringae]|uniref:Lipase-like C-terminal domain-containing protein n=1 Tax=Phytophthora pseudosyringae TaxID=221518 RepID=A0A8T1VAJ8_9STRA|nr:hypothetical protein PHYPSEUDO_010606 [Phytophthora pseudosyringae]